MDGRLTVFDWMAQPARFLLGIPGAGAVQSQPDETGVIENLVALGMMDSRTERGARGVRIEPLGEIGQGIVPKRRPDSKASTRRGMDQPFDTEETPGAQQMSDEQGPEQGLSRDARPNAAIARVLEIGLQPQTMGSVVEDLQRAGSVHRGCCFRHSTSSSALAARTSLRAS